VKIIFLKELTTRAYIYLTILSNTFSHVRFQKILVDPEVIVAYHRGRFTKHRQWRL